MPEEDSGFMRVCMTMHAGRGGEEAVRRGPPRLGDAIPEVHQRAPRRRGEGRGVTKEGVRRQNAPVPEPRRLDAQTARDRAQLAAPGEGAAWRGQHGVHSTGQRGHHGHGREVLGMGAGQGPRRRQRHRREQLRHPLVSTLSFRESSLLRGSSIDSYTVLVQTRRGQHVCMSVV